MKVLLTKNNTAIPFIGLGTFPFQERVMADMVKDCLKVGYRLIDTSDDYRGESGIGMALDELPEIGLKREEIFLQTKITDNDSYADESLTGMYFNKYSKIMQRHSVEEIVRNKVEKSLYDMHTDYLDSLLIHQPYPDYMVEIWNVMIKLKDEGIVRYIGVSNFRERHIDKLVEKTGVYPEINECYASPIGTKDSLVNYCNQHDCLFMTYSPLKEVARNLIPLKDISYLMEKYNKSLAQIVLRWNIERGCLPLPKTKNSKRLSENFDVFDFTLTADEVDLISSLNYNYQYLVESKMCVGI